MSNNPQSWYDFANQSCKGKTVSTQALSLPSKKWSIAAWASAAAVSVILSYLLMLAIALACIGLPILWLLAGSGMAYSVFLLSVFGLVMGGTILWSLIPRRDKFEPPGVPIDLTRQPRLHAEIAYIAAALGEPLPAEVYLVPEANAFVAQRGGIMGVGSRRVMGLGLPLLQTLDISQFRAVLAHEFAHFYAGDTRLGPWVYNTRSAILRVFQNLGNASPFLSALSRFVIIYVAYTIIVKSLVLYWKLFMRLTQFISRRQEFRSDELACYVAGAEPLMEGLKTVNRSAVANAPYWQSVIFPMVQNGHHPPVASGFAQFMLAPHIAEAAANHLEQQLKNPRTSPFDTHPPLSARLAKASALHTPAVELDTRPAISLMDDLPALELSLLQKLAPALASKTLKPAAWETLGTDVYIPMWRSHTAAFVPLLARQNVADLPDLLKRLEPISSQLKDPPGLLLTRDQRTDRAAGVVQSALILALLDHGWTLEARPGFVSLAHQDLILEPARVFPKLRSGEFKGQDWSSYCEKAGIGGWPLAQTSDAATA